MSIALLVFNLTILFMLPKNRDPIKTFSLHYKKVVFCITFTYSIAISTVSLFFLHLKIWPLLESVCNIDH